MKNVHSNSSNLYSKVHKLDVDKLLLVPVYLSKLNDLVKMMLLKLFLCNTKIKDTQDKIPVIIINLATNTTLNAKLNQVKNKILNITNLAVTIAFTGVENEILHHSKYITTPKFNK